MSSVQRSILVSGESWIVSSQKRERISNREKKTFCVVHGLKSRTETAEGGDDDGIIQKANNLSKVESKSWGNRATPPPVAAFHISDNDNQ